MNVGSTLFAGSVLAVGLVYEAMALKMPRGTLAYPGPGFAPVLVGAFLIATALGCLVQELRPRSRAAAPAPVAAEGARDTGKVVQLVAVMVGYALLLKPLGFPIAVCALVAIAIRIFGYRRWVRAVAIASVVAAFSYVSFAVWLKVPLPLGLLEPLLG
jgi:putative tricarboxylic transport membrane protein